MRLEAITIVWIVFTIIFVSYLLIARHGILFKARQRPFKYAASAIFGGLLCLLSGAAFTMGNADYAIQTGMGALLLFSYFLDAKGLGTDALFLSSLDLKGFSYSTIQRIVLLDDKKTASVKLNYFRYDRRGPLLKFNYPIEEITAFLAEHAPDVVVEIEEAE